MLSRFREAAHGGQALSQVRLGEPGLCFVEGESMPVLRAELVRSVFWRKHSSCDCSQAPWSIPVPVSRCVVHLLLSSGWAQLRSRVQGHPGAAH